MILRSGKKLCSSVNNDETKEDIISNLPDSLLIQILSLLSPYYVKETRIVSKRWKNLFAFLPNLTFVRNNLMEPVENFHAIVNQILDTRACMPIEKLLLKCKTNCDLDCFYDLLCILVRFKAGVRELELRFPMFIEDGNSDKVIKFFWHHLFKTWDSIVGLTLHGGYVLHVPNDKLMFPRLKKLSLLYIYDLSCESLANLFSGCPVLEELYVEIANLYYDFNISSLSLKRLCISFYGLPRNFKVVINAPLLEYIYISDYANNHYSLTKPLSLVEANIESFGVISQLLPFLSSAKILKLTHHLATAGVRELELRLPVFFEDRDMNKVIKFCWDHLFKTWDSIVGLTLHGGFVLHVPNDKLMFPCLKKLGLLYIYDLSCESVANLFSGCPVLEELYVETNLCYDFNISSLSLKRRSISFYQQNKNYKVVINAPKLEYIFVRDYSASRYSMTKPLSLVEANIVESFGVISQLLPCLSYAKILNLTHHLTGVIRDHVRDLSMPIFPNLVKLVTGWGLDFLPVWLDNMPNLEHITFSYWRRPVIIDLNLPEETPVCLRFKMKEIIVTDGIDVEQDEFTFIRYLLKHSITLEKFRFHAHHKNPERRDQLLSFHCGSEHCQIEFV